MPQLRSYTGIRNAVDEIFELITSALGEGVVLKEPGSKYDHGRSDSLLKLKVTRRSSPPPVSDDD